MIYDPSLSTLSINDLLQRYKNTCVVYNDRAVRIHSFSTDGYQTTICYEDLILKVVREESFNPEYLNIEIPSPRWVAITKKSPLFLYHTSKKKFCRGLSFETIGVLAPCFYHVEGNICWNMMLACLLLPKMSILSGALPNGERWQIHPNGLFLDVYSPDNKTTVTYYKGRQI